MVNFLLDGIAIGECMPHYSDILLYIDPWPIQWQYENCWTAHGTHRSGKHFDVHDWW